MSRAAEPLVLTAAERDEIEAEIAEIRVRTNGLLEMPLVDQARRDEYKLTAEREIARLERLLGEPA